MKKILNLFMTICIALTMVLVPCVEVRAEGSKKATINVQIQNVFVEEFKGDISLCLRNPSSDDVREFKGGAIPQNATFEVENFGECKFLSVGNEEWCFVDAITLKAPQTFSVKENDVISVSLLLFPTEKNKEYGDYVKIYEESLNALMENEIIADVLEDIGIGNTDSSSIQNHNNSNAFDFNSWHKNAMASYNNFSTLFLATEDDSTWTSCLSNAEVRRNVSLTYYLNSVNNANENTWLNMSKSEILLWQNTYLVFVEMIDKGDDYFNKTFESQQTTDKWLKSIIAISSWNGNGNAEIKDAYNEWLNYQIEYYGYYGYPYNFINDKSYAEETSLFQSSDSEITEDEEILEDLTDEDIKEIEEETKNDGIAKKSANNWLPVLEKLKKSWLTLIILALVATAYFVVRKIRKSKNLDEMSK